MDWQAFRLSLELGALTLLVLMPLALVLGRALALSRSRFKPLFEAALAMPLVLPPTVLGFYLLVGLGGASPIGQFVERFTGQRLVFTFEGLLVASVLVNIPFAVQPIQRAFEAIGPDLREAAVTCGLSWWRGLWRIELPLAWPGILTGAALTFAHTLGEFGVVLMVGGNIAGETRTIAIAIYDSVQAFDDRGAGQMAGFLVLVSIAAIVLTFLGTRHIGRRHGP